MHHDLQFTDLFLQIMISLAGVGGGEEHVEEEEKKPKNSGPRTVFKEKKP